MAKKADKKKYFVKMKGQRTIPTVTIVSDQTPSGFMRINEVDFDEKTMELYVPGKSTKKAEQLDEKTIVDEEETEKTESAEETHEAEVGDDSQVESEETTRRKRSKKKQ